MDMKKRPLALLTALEAALVAVFPLGVWGWWLRVSSCRIGWAYHALWTLGCLCMAAVVGLLLLLCHRLRRQSAFTVKNERALSAMARLCACACVVFAVLCLHAVWADFPPAQTDTASRAMRMPLAFLSESALRYIPVAAMLGTLGLAGLFYAVLLLMRRAVAMQEEADLTV